ncbi:MAG: type VII toxin-antitoxin system HepT family RNase toxin [Desulfurispora sp.]|uniref:type VII toxin-antitoxin system HepT family RNase toxin n=1 Tax=Desulfurispora sp. TaxID=3014275 RepID=UPI00404AF38F
MVDRQVISEKLKYLAEYISDLEGECGVSFEEFNGNKMLRRYVERTLHLAIECCLDIGSHIISSDKLREPEDNKDIFVVLVENKYLPAGDLDTWKKMARFRNLIVHSYARIDPEILYAIWHRNISDLKKFAGNIQKKLLLS